MRKTAFIYHEDLASFDYGSRHPLKTVRLKITRDLIRSFGLFELPGTRSVEARNATDEEIALFHMPGYIEMLKAVNSGAPVPGCGAYGLGPGDNPVFRGVYDWSIRVAGATLQAVEMVDEGDVDIAFNIAGGLHHAMPARASGFCYVNDAAVAIKWLLGRGRRVAYVDIDAHHGDGVQEGFYDTDRVLTISIHETGRSLFPGTGFEEEAGTGAGTGYSVNVPVLAYADDEVFVRAFRETVPGLLERFKPDIVVTQLGVDSLQTDPLTHLNLTTNGFEEMLRGLRERCPRWVALGGGGYDVGNVARAWTLAWALMNGVDLPERMPDAFLQKTGQLAGFRGNKLRDRPVRETGQGKALMMTDLDRVLRALRHHSFLYAM